MNLSKLPGGSRVFVDANILVYNFIGKDDMARACQSFLRRTAIGELKGFTSACVAADVIHRIMIAEARERLRLPPREIVSYLKAHPDEVRSLKRYLSIPSDIYRLGVSILDVTYRELHTSKRVRAEYGLLTNDSIIVALMQKYKILHLATNDQDFKRVKGIKVWMPV